MGEFEKLVKYIDGRIDWKFFNYLCDKITSFQDKGWDIKVSIFLTTEVMDSKYTTLYSTNNTNNGKLNFMVIETPFWHDTLYANKNKDIVYGIFYNINHKGYTVHLIDSIYEKIKNKCNVLEMNRITLYIQPNS